VRIAVVGAGGVGCYFGGRLARAGGDIHLLARGRHLQAIRDRGLRISGARGEFAVALPATDDPADIGPSDIVLFCVKSYDTEAAVELLPPLLHATTAVVSLQNGIDSDEKIAARVGPEHVMGGAAFIFASVVEPGVVHDAGDRARLYSASLTAPQAPAVKRCWQCARRPGFSPNSSPTFASVSGTSLRSSAPRRA
jgi:2-dehydropantoate 2-reductase